MGKKRAVVHTLITARFVSFDHQLSCGLKMDVTIIHLRRKIRRNPTHLKVLT